jgi:predicted secreted Zn-dependent protease
MEAYTKPQVTETWYRNYDAPGGCAVVTPDGEGLSISFLVDIPDWSPDAASTSYIINWWNAEILRVAIHEKHHVNDGNEMVVEASQALKTSNCDNVETNLNTVYTNWEKADCQFDLDEYGTAMGETMATCMAKRSS